MTRPIVGQAGDGPRKPTSLHRLMLAIGWLAAAGPFPAHAQDQETTMQLYRSDASSISRAPESTFTGDVQIGGYFQRAAPSRLSGAVAIFAPGSRTPWKVNPVGQTLVVTGGVGWAQVEGEAIVEIRAGDVVWFPPGQRHWEGATPDRAMTYFAVQEGGVQFGAAVSDAEYRQGPQAE